MHTGLGRSQVEVQQCALSSEVGEEQVEVEVDADMVEEKLEEEAEEEEARRRRRRKRRRAIRGGEEQL